MQTISRGGRGRSAGVLLVLTLLVLLALNSAAFASSSAYPDESIVRADQGVLRGSTGWGPLNVLVVQDGLPWGSPIDLDMLDQLRINYVGITSAKLADTDLSPFQAILMPSVQSPSYQANVLASLDEISVFVADGGWLIAHMAEFFSDPWSSSPLPGCPSLPVQGVGFGDLTIVSPPHYLASGLTNTALDGWNWSSHGYFTGLPFSARVIFRTALERYPVYITYPWGEGRVVATMMTLEWYQANPRVLLNELKWVQGQLTVEARRLGHTR